MSEITIVGRVPWSSNATFLVEGADGNRGIYKPERGELPLGDFPPGIWRREIAAYELARALGWDCIPPTRASDGPLGIGSVQQFIETDYAEHYFTMLDANDSDINDQLRRIAVFDLIANNTDRKAGHCLIDRNSHVWAIDNALCFHRHDKLRTVIWDFAGQRIRAPFVDDICRFLDEGIDESLARWLSDHENDALIARAHNVVRAGTYPHDDSGYRYPWPLI